MGDDREVIMPLSALGGMGITAAPALYGHINIGNGMVKIHLGTGQVAFGPGYVPDEAARSFWEAISRQFPGVRRMDGRRV